MILRWAVEKLVSRVKKYALNAKRMCDASVDCTSLVYASISEFGYYLLEHCTSRLFV
jgi:hypothetical protein